jgi:ABC-type polysaccharide/polyol phosphate transport system ATPase subunit
MNAIAVQNLGKKFKLFTSPGGRFLEYMSMGKVKRHTDFWALKDISFDIPTGTTLGILGQNGSGKSTLLSILAGVLYSSAGSFEIKGKVSAILELGSGFHPEFSGRDNVYMYGSIMGLSKQQIDERFNEIVLFSELGDFIDQPLRTYSSGMIVRLAFSVAVHVDADILIVDEALAVGDAIFQHRCFRKIREMQTNGKTILYVGHDTEAVRNLCTQALLLDGGRIIERGDPNYVVNKYYALIAEREQAYSEGNVIEHGEIPGEGFETVYSFVQNLNTAKVIAQPTIPVREQTIEINSSPRKVIFAHPPSEIEYSVFLPPESSLAFAIGIMPGAWDKIPQGVKFDIDILSAGIKENIFSRVLQPKRNIGDRGWHNFIVPLERFSGKTVSIIFRTSGSGDDLSYGWSAWGWGKIIKTNHLKDTAIGPTETEKKPNEPSNNIDNARLSRCEFRYGNKKAEIIKIELLNEKGDHSLQYNSGELVEIKVHVFFHQEITGLVSVGCVIKNRFCEVYGTNNWWKNIPFPDKKKNTTIIVKYTMPLKLAQGLYSITPGVAIVHTPTEIEYLDMREDCLFFRVNKYEHIAGIVDLEATMEFLSD